MDVALIALIGLVAGLVLVLVLLGLRPLLARLAARNIARRKTRVAIVIAGLLVGTAIISSSLVVGDTLRSIFLQDVYTRLDAIDEMVWNSFNGNLYSFPQAYETQIATNLAQVGAPVDGVAPLLLKTMPVRNIAGNKGNQAITVMGLNGSAERGFGALTTLAGASVDVNDLGPSRVYLNQEAAGDLNATRGQDLTLFYGTTNRTLVHVVVQDLVLSQGKAAYQRDPIIIMDLALAQSAFNETGAINAIKVSNTGGVEDGVAYTDAVVQDLRLFIAQQHWNLGVEPVKQEGIDGATQIGAQATELFLVMGAFSIVAGVLLIANIFVMLAEERKQEMGVARALGFLRRELLITFALEGTFYAITAAAIGAATGVGLGWVMIWIFDKVVPHGNVPVTFAFEDGSVLLAFVAGAALTWASILLASWRVSRLNIVHAIRDLPEPGGLARSRQMAVAGGLLLLVGAALSWWGWTADTGLGKIPGLPLAAVGIALAFAADHARLGFTLASGFNIAWLLGPFGLVNPATDNISVAFVTTGLILVGSAILIAVFNVSEVSRALLRRASRDRGRPVLRTAVSYPMDKRFRTGMTIAMFALIMFMITLISMVQGLEQSSLNEFVAQQSGGYDVVAYTTSYGTIPNFRASLMGNFSESEFLNGWNGVASASVLPAKLQAVGGNRTYDYTLWGVDNFLVKSNQYGFYSNLPYVTDANGTRHELQSRTDVWLALRENHSLAIIDRSAAGVNQFAPDPNRLQAVPGDRIRVFDPTGHAVNLTVVGILEQSLQFTSGVFVDINATETVFPAAEQYTAYFFQVAPGTDVTALRTQLEQVYFPYGLQTIDIREQIGQAFDSTQEVLTLMEAYLGIGLLVGIAGLAVVTLRAVVERRTQIGALRAIGFTRGMVLRMFLLEIALIAVLGVGIGVGLGIVFAYKVYLVYFAGVITFSVPWVNLGIIVGIASAAAVACTAQPAIRASRLPPAEALRYSE
ncbi:MAG TPA: FtsX-like permease family protein [Thermoplasmata archaeon]|nr:FtsX-like permease family protein [Thermoplasmata archaeon]